MKILTILGARPQFIKASSVSREIEKYNNEIKEVIVHTGQHYDKNMSDIFFDGMNIPKPKYYLGIKGKTHGTMTGQMIEKIEEVVLKENPNWIIVYGDTNSTLAGAIVASKLHIKLAHIEAGLRSFNMNMPEEINRVITDRISNILFCPTKIAVKNLSNEGYDNLDCKIINSGDVMFDGVLFYRKLSVKPNYTIESNYILCTIHRAENTDNEMRIKNIFCALRRIAKEKNIILPLHPRTKKIINNLNINTDNLIIIEPMGYLEMLWLIDNCDLVMTDSGGLQKEAYFFEKPCVTLRDETEWVELVDNGFNKLVGADEDKIVDTVINYVNIDKKKFKTNLYGDGKASNKIIKNMYDYT